MSHPGLNTNRSRRGKYGGCERSQVRGITVRLLSPTEIDEFKAHIQRLIAPEIRQVPKYRRAVV